MTGRARVLVVDEWTETADVLRAVLEPRGIAVQRADRLAISRPAESESGRPEISLLVVDADSAAHRALPAGALENVPRVVIGTLPAPPGGSGSSDRGLRYFRKPFQYAELLAAVEAAIDARPGANHG